MSLTPAEEDKIELIVMRAVKSYDKEISDKITEKISTHVITCPTKRSFDRFRWFMLGSFASGFAGGGAIGAWITAAVKSGAFSYWIDSIKGWFV
jgi:hypothetical protein